MTGVPSRTGTSVPELCDWIRGLAGELTKANRCSGERLLNRLPELSDRQVQDIPGNCPRLFISHRQHPDYEAWARRIAALDKASGYDYWLDVYDPNLPYIAGLVGMSEEAKA